MGGGGGLLEFYCMSVVAVASVAWRSSHWEGEKGGRGGKRGEELFCRSPLSHSQ